MEKMASDGPKWDHRGFFPTNPDLADGLGRKDLSFDFFIFGLQLYGFPGPQISKFPDFQIPRFPDFQTPPAPPPDELSDPHLTPLPTHPGIKYVARALAATK